MKICEGFVLRDIAGEQVIMPAGKNIAAFDGAVALNEVSAFIYSSIEANPGITLQELTSKITDTYEVDSATAEKDCSEVLSELEKYGIIER